MTVEETQVAEVVVAGEETKKVTEETEKVYQGDDEVKDVDESKPKTVQKSSSYKEESNFLTDLKEFERKALTELKVKLEEAILGNNLYRKEDPKKTEDKPVAEEKGGEESEKPVEEAAENKEEEKEEGVEKEDAAVECEEEKKRDTDISLWGVPLLPSKGAEGTDVVLLKFLRAREFKVNDAFEMLRKTLQWRKEAEIDSILDDELCADLSSAAYMNGVDREGHPVCYNIFGVFDSEELYQKTFGTDEKRRQFLRWRCQLMEKGIQKLDLKPGGASSLIQINDLKKSPGPAKKELRIATKQAIGIFQDNYPELVAKNVCVLNSLYQLPFLDYVLKREINGVLIILDADLHKRSFLVLCSQCPYISLLNPENQEQICCCSPSQGNRDSAQVSILSCVSPEARITH